MNRQPSGDVNLSTSSHSGTGSTERAFHAQADDDLHSSSVSIPQARVGMPAEGAEPFQSNNALLFHPYGDANPSISDTSNHTDSREHQFANVQHPVGNHAISIPSTSADAHHGNDRQVPRLSADRPLHDIHFGKVCSKGSKTFNRSLMVAAKFSDDDRNKVTSHDHQRACIQIMDIWIEKNKPTIVSELLHLLTQAGGDNPRKYHELIEDIAHNPP